MVSSKTISAICLGATLCAAQTINISGRVLDSEKITIPGATVRLLDTDISAVTDANGRFTLTKGTTAIQPPVKNVTMALGSFQFQNGKIAFTLTESAPVEIIIHNILGRQIYKSRLNFGSGTHMINSPMQSDGIYLYNVKVGKDSYSFKSLPFGKFSIERAASSIGTYTLARQAKVSEDFADIISVVKEGQLNYMGRQY